RDLTGGGVDENVGQAEVAMADHHLGALLGETNRQLSLDLFHDLCRRGVLQCHGEELDDDAVLGQGCVGKSHHLHEGPVEGASINGETVQGSDREDYRAPCPLKGWSVELT